MSMLSDAQTWLADQLTDHGSVSVVYSRGASTVTLKAIPGRPRVEREEMGGKSRVKIDDEWVDFHIKPSLINFGAGVVEPARADLITIGSVIREVMPMDAEPCWRKSDVSGSMYAVRTKRTT